MKRKISVENATIVAVALGIITLSIIAIVTGKDESLPKETTMVTATTITTTATTTTTTTVTTLEVRKYLPEYDRFSYKEGIISTTSVVVRNSQAEVVDYIKKGETFFYMEHEKFDGMVHIYYERYQTIYDGWIPENTDWWS